MPATATSAVASPGCYPDAASSLLFRLSEDAQGLFGERNLQLRLLTQGDARLRKHADYQRVYQGSRKHFSPSMTYFFSERPSTARPALPGARIGLTAGRVMGKAVDRNRIKRRMREAVRLSLNLLTRDVDVVLHPRRTVLTLEFTTLQNEIAKIFAGIEKAAGKAAGKKDGRGDVSSA